MKFSYDVARCNGHYNQVPFGKQIDIVCIDCLRRARTEYVPHIGVVGVVVNDVCINKIKDQE